MLPDPLGNESRLLPVWAELAPSEQWSNLEAPLGKLDLSPPTPSVREWGYRESFDPEGQAEFRRRIGEWDRQVEEIWLGRRRHLGTWNQLTYDLAWMERTQAGVKLHCKLGTYFHSLTTSEVLEPEIVDAFSARPDHPPEQAWSHLGRRAWLHERVADPVADGRHRSAAIGISTLTIVRVRQRELDGYTMMLSPSSIGVAPQQGRCHVVPSGMFQPFTNESPDRIRAQFSVRSMVLRELVEELFGVEELETGDGRTDPDAIFDRPEAEAITQMLDRGDAHLLYSGVAVNLLTLRPEICTLLIVHDPDWYEEQSASLQLWDGHLKRSRRTEPLPDQAWIQLVTLTNDRLEPDAAWRESLQTGTVVMPSWACIDLGLRVARHVLA